MYTRESRSRARRPAANGVLAERAAALAIAPVLLCVLALRERRGVVFGVLCGLRGRIATARDRQAIVGLTIASSLAMIVFVGWILPVSDQVFRELTFGGPVARGTNELTIAELASGRLTEGEAFTLASRTRGSSTSTSG